jgi:flagellar biosynthetic protein FliP
MNTIMRAKTIIVGAFILYFLSTLTVTAQQISIGLGESGSLSATSFQLIALITVLSLVPGLAVMVTCFPFIVTVLSILRQAIGLQQAPPNMLIVTLALFLTYFVMDPVFQAAWEQGVSPLIDERLEIQDAIPLIISPFRSFMEARVDSETLQVLSDLRSIPVEELNSESAPPLSILVPSFLLSELEKAFQIGFLIFLPFLIIDLVVAAVLMSMGMMMVPPALVSLPFKLAFFVVADGWSVISVALVQSYL